ncbi:CPI_1c_G0026530.mRNA.1.CDS.1 [Saccharomyces cerevisiae]|nr:CPI_1c_G0026530.mRNA.1.CDS.1 [Saccharomyces cerevisiae]CAI7243317.1 CPI_1c_G0026530.mRNA.1.CDS.1 [Saccharomyces cerevisiae]
MKFADHLTESAIPEWRDKYIDYKVGKKKLRRYKEKLDAEEEQSSSYRSWMPSVSVYQTAFQQREPGKSRSDGDYRSGPAFKKDYSALQREFVADFIEDWLISFQLSKCNEFYLWLLKECDKKFEVLQSQLHYYSLQKNYERDNLNRSSSNVDMSTSLYAAGLAGRSDSRVNSIDSDSRSVMYGSMPCTKEAKKPRLSLLAYCQKVLKDNRLLPSWPKRGFSLLQDLRQDASSRGRETFAFGASFLETITTTQARNLLSNAIIEYYLYLQLVKSFRDINVTGFRKMVKKFDKTCHTRELTTFMSYARTHYTLFKHADANVQLVAQKMQQITSSQPTPTSELSSAQRDKEPITWLETQITEWFTTALTNSPKDRKHNTHKLKKLTIQYSISEQMVHRNNRSIVQMLVVGLGIGVSMTLITYTLYLGISSEETSFTHKILFPLWGGWYMVLLIAFLFLVNCFIWHRTGINYRFIMLGEIQSKNGTQFFNNDFATSKIPLKLYFLTFFIVPCAVCSMLSFALEKLTPLGFLYIGIVSFLFLCPSGLIPYWDKVVHTRKWLVVTLIRLMMSGFFPVEFGDFFLGDIICSLTYSIADIAMFFCVYSHTPNSLCGSSHSRAMGVLSCLPSYWRFMQCLRRFADSGDWFPHLLNAAKYTLGIAYNATLCAYRLSDRSEQRRTPFIVCATLNSILTSAWDLVMDWSVAHNTTSYNWLLRDDLYLAGKKNWENGSYSFSRKLVYYFAMIWDILIRFEWIVYAIAPQTIQQSAVTSFILALLEVLRRFVWIIFRVENEHVANVHLFRVTGDAPLPYPIAQVGDDSMDSSDLGSKAFSSLNDIPITPSHDNNPHSFAEPMPAYRGTFRRRSSVFENISRSIPWAHATDFQRPTVNTVDDRSPETDSESEVESIM